MITTQANVLMAFNDLRGAFSVCPLLIYRLFTDAYLCQLQNA